jgi:hypothetical protein
VRPPPGERISRWTELGYRSRLFRMGTGYWAGTMPSWRDELERRGDLTRVFLDTAFGPWGGSHACVDAYELGIRTAADLHLTVAGTVGLEPVRSLASTCADLVRDIGATQLSTARWFLDV